MYNVCTVNINIYRITKVRFSNRPRDIQRKRSFKSERDRKRRRHSSSDRPLSFSKRKLQRSRHAGRGIT